MILTDAYSYFRDHLRGALDERLYPVAFLDELISGGLVQILSTDRSAIVFGAKSYPSGLTDVHGLVAAGDIEDIVQLLIPRAEAWGKAHGCSGAVIESRPGWARILKHHGYEPHQLAVRKEL